jgi:hypothetical protein
MHGRHRRARNDGALWVLDDAGHLSSGDALRECARARYGRDEGEREQREPPKNWDSAVSSHVVVSRNEHYESLPLTIRARGNSCMTVMKKNEEKDR